MFSSPRASQSEVARPETKHWSIFYPHGIDEQDPPVLHYLHLGCWCTAACDYWRHRDPHEKENPGHRVSWLHIAKPRDRFVFLIEPVEKAPAKSLWSVFWTMLYSTPPAFAVMGGKVLWSRGDLIGSPRDKDNCEGVEVVEVQHRDVTALDYCPSMTSTRLAIETRVVTTRWFKSRKSALIFYEIVPVEPKEEPEEIPDKRSFARDGRSETVSPRNFSLSPPSQHAAKEGSEEIEASIHSSQSESAGREASRGLPANDRRQHTTTPPPIHNVLNFKSSDSMEQLVDASSIDNYHYNTMVIVYTQDPHFNACIRELLMPEEGTFPFTRSLEEQKRLLTMCEAGMPSWCIFFSRFGLPYRRWFRLVAVAILNFWPLIALLVGLYDLYKHMPYLKEFLAEQLHPLTAWVEEHFTIRISFLVTYLFTVSFNMVGALHSFGKSMIALATLVLSPAYPMLQLIFYLWVPIRYLWQFFTIVVKPFVLIAFSVWQGIVFFFTTPFTLMMTTLRLIFATNQPAVVQGVRSASLLVQWWRTWLEFWDKVARPVKNLAKACYDGVVHVGTILIRHEESLRRRYSKKVRRVIGFFFACCRRISRVYFAFSELPAYKRYIIVIGAMTVIALLVLFSEYFIMPLVDVVVGCYSASCGAALRYLGDAATDAGGLEEPPSQMSTLARRFVNWVCLPSPEGVDAEAVGGGEL